MTGLSGKPTLNKVGIETQNTKTSEINTIEKQDTTILKLDNKKINDRSNKKDGKVQLPLHQYNSYCPSGGVNLNYNGQGDKFHSKYPCNNKRYMGKPAPGWSTKHDKTATFTEQMNSMEQKVECWKGWLNMDGTYCETKGVT